MCEGRGSATGELGLALNLDFAAGAGITHSAATPMPGPLRNVDCVVTVPALRGRTSMRGSSKGLLASFRSLVRWAAPAVRQFFPSFTSLQPFSAEKTDDMINFLLTSTASRSTQQQSNC